MELSAEKTFNKRGPGKNKTKQTTRHTTVLQMRGRLETKPFLFICYLWTLPLPKQWALGLSHLLTGQMCWGAERVGEGLKEPFQFIFPFFLYYPLICTSKGVPESDFGPLKKFKEKTRDV